MRRRGGERPPHRPAGPRRQDRPETRGSSAGVATCDVKCGPQCTASVADAAHPCLGDCFDKCNACQNQCLGACVATKPLDANALDAVSAPSVRP